jgi:hypothetical protein
MHDETSVNRLQHIGDILSSKYKASFQGTFRASNPVYVLPKPLILPKNRSFEAALIYFATDNYLVNIDETNQQFIYSTDKGATWKTIRIPIGAYELSSITEQIKQQMRVNGDNSDIVNVSANLNTFSCVIEISDDNYQVDFRPEKTIRDLLGFHAAVLSKGKNESPKTVQITSAKAVNVHCSLIHQSYDSRGIESDIIYSFPAYKVGIGWKINEEPNTPRYLPVGADVIKEIRFRISDNNDKELTFKNEECAFCIYLSQV